MLDIVRRATMLQKIILTALFFVFEHLQELISRLGDTQVFMFMLRVETLNNKLHLRKCLQKFSFFI